MEQMSDVVDILIVGGGPTGLFGAYYAGFRGMKTTIIDSLTQLGGQLAALYPEKLIFDVGGFPKIRGKDLIDSLTEQALQFKPQIILEQAVTTLEFDESQKIYTVHTTGGVIYTRTILIAAGIGAFRPKQLPADQVQGYEGNGVDYVVRELESYRNKRVLVIGGGDSAVDWANALSDIADSVTVIHRRDGFRAAESSVEQMKAAIDELLVFYELKELQGNGKVERAVIFNNKTKEDRTLQVDAVLVNIGFLSSLGAIKDWGLELEGTSIQVDQMMRTNRPGVFAAGDVTAYPGKLKLIATGFAEAATAVNHAKHYIEPSANVFPGHSSEKVKQLTPLRVVKAAQ